jgi:hypothetical protein
MGGSAMRGFWLLGRRLNLEIMAKPEVTYHPTGSLETTAEQALVTNASITNDALEIQWLFVYAMLSWYLYNDSNWRECL